MKNYGQERNFQARRVLRAEQMQTAVAQRESQLSDKFLTQYDKMLSSQLDSIGKVGSVIGLVEKVFNVQLEHQTGTVQLQQDIDKLKDVLANLDTHYETQYAAARQLILTFDRKTRMDWPRLNQSEQDLAAKARIIFDSIPESLLKRKDAETPSDLAQVYQLLGASALYANDIESAERKLERAYEIYSRLQSKGSRTTNHPHAACCYFLALIEKNWKSNGLETEENLSKAKRYLEEARALLEDAVDEFLVPVTLAEVSSYSESNRLAASKMLDRTIEELCSIPKRNPNQESLLQRAYLLRGNLDFLDGFPDKALERYAKASKMNPNNPYAMLSTAQTESLKAMKGDSQSHYRDGLRLLKESKALEKQELSGRVLALAWAIIAAHELGDQSEEHERWKELEVVGDTAREVNKRKPLFFSPVAKTIVTFGELKQTLQTQTARNKT